MRTQKTASRLRFSFCPNFELEEHRKAWSILQAVPDGSKSSFIVGAILRYENDKNLEETLRCVVREELQNLEFTNPTEPQELEIPKQMLGFLQSLSEE